MWTPTHVQVTVLQARNLIPKGKGGTNDAYVTIQLGKEKFQTSVKGKSDQPEWFEECDLPIPDKSQATVILNVFHRSFMKIDEFLGHLSLPLQDFPIYEKPISRWYGLKSKPSKKDASQKYRGEIEVKITFIVQSKSSSEMNLAKIGRDKRLGSLRSLEKIGSKLKLPSRSSSFGKGDKKTPTAVVEPVRAQPFDSSPKPPDSPEPVLKSMPMRSSNLSNSKQFSISTPRLTTSTLYDIDIDIDDTCTAERSVDESPATTLDIPSPDNKDNSQTPFQSSPAINHHLDRVKLSDFDHNTHLSQSHSLDDDDEDEPKVERSSLRARSRSLQPNENIDLSKLPWSPEDSPRITAQSGGDDFGRFDRTRQPILRGSGRLKKRPSFGDADNRQEARRTKSASLSEQGDAKPQGHTRSLSDFTDRKSACQLSSSAPDSPCLSDSGRGSDCSPSLTPRHSGFLRSHCDSERSSTRSRHSIHEPIPEDSELKPDKDMHGMYEEKEKDESDSSKHVLDEKPLDNIQASPKRKIIPGPEITSEISQPEDFKDVYNNNNSQRYSEQESIKAPLHILQDYQNSQEKIPFSKDQPALSADISKQFETLSKEDLIRLVVAQKDMLAQKASYITDLETYIDNLLVRVITQTPKLLQSNFQQEQSLNLANNRTPNNDSKNLIINNKQSKKNKNEKKKFSLLRK